MTKLSWTYSGKKNYWQNFYSRATRGEFLICEETCSRVFLNTFLNQSRTMRFHPTGRVAIPFDDEANVVSFVTDPEVLRKAPRRESRRPDPWWVRKSEPETTWGTRHIRV